MWVLITGGPAWAIGCLAQYVSFDNALIVWQSNGDHTWCDAGRFKYVTA